MFVLPEPRMGVGLGVNVWSLTKCLPEMHLQPRYWLNLGTQSGVASPVSGCWIQHSMFSSNRILSLPSHKIPRRTAVSSPDRRKSLPKTVLLPSLLLHRSAAAAWGQTSTLSLRLLKRETVLNKAVDATDISFAFTTTIWHTNVSSLFRLHKHSFLPDYV